MLNQNGELDVLRDMPVAFSVFRVLLDEDGRPCDAVCAYVNDAAARIEGFACGQGRGTTLSQMYSDVDPGMLAVMGETAHHGVKQHFTRRIADARYLSIQTYQPLPGYCALVMHDVSDLAHQENARKAEREQLAHQAARDPLTGLYNVREGRALAKRALASPRWVGARGALFMFDLDDFKQVNDEFGHDRGDAVLKGFARVLERSFRCSDIVYRAGGDEFSAFAPDIPCACVAERICADVVASVEEMAAASIGVTVSIGVAVGRPTHAFEAFYRAADQALYGIKRTGKSSYRITDMDDVRARDVQGPAASCDDEEEGDTGSAARTLPAA